MSSPPAQTPLPPNSADPDRTLDRVDVFDLSLGVSIRTTIERQTDNVLFDNCGSDPLPLSQKGQVLTGATNLGDQLALCTSFDQNEGIYTLLDDGTAGVGATDPIATDLPQIDEVVQLPGRYADAGWVIGVPPIDTLRGVLIPGDEVEPPIYVVELATGAWFIASAAWIYGELADAVSVRDGRLLVRSQPRAPEASRAVVYRPSWDGSASLPIDGYSFTVLDAQRAFVITPDALQVIQIPMEQPSGDSRGRGPLLAPVDRRRRSSLRRRRGLERPRPRRADRRRLGLPERGRRSVPLLAAARARPLRPPPSRASPSAPTTPSYRSCTAPVPVATPSSSRPRSSAVPSAATSTTSCSRTPGPRTPAGSSTRCATAMRSACGSTRWMTDACG